jgi:hypothetical protein
MPGSFEDDELAVGVLGKSRTARHRRDRVGFAVDHEDGATYAATEGARLFRC